MTWAGEFSQQALRQAWHEAGVPARWLVAFSGGLDSAVLLHAAADLATHGQLDSLRAIHVDHGLQPESSAWVQHCRQRCAEWGVELHTVSVQVARQPRESLEMAARRARYAVFAEHLQPGEALLTAHHADDQLETVLLRLLRGSGPRGLGGIRALQPFAAGLLWRPLLRWPRAALLEYARRHELAWVEDASNADLVHDRNYLRARVLPGLLERWPQAAHTVARSAELAREADGLLAAWAAQELGEAFASGGLPLEWLRQRPPAQQRNLLRQVLRARGLPVPSWQRLEEARRQAIESRHDRSPAVRWDGAEIRRYGEKLYLLGHLPEAPSGTGRLTSEAPYRDALGELQLVPAAEGELGLADMHIRPHLEVRYRRGGEWFHPAGRDRPLPLTRWLSARRVPPWWRDRVPLLYCEDRLVAVARWAVAQSAVATEGVAAWRVVWTPQPALGDWPATSAG